MTRSREEQSVRYWMTDKGWDELGQEPPKEKTMPRVVCCRIGFVWMAFVLDDYDKPGKARFGLSAEKAIQRAAKEAF